MFVGLIVGLAVMLVCPLIPIAHFVLVPASPFIAGYWGISFAPNTQRHYALHGLLYGLSLALLVGLVAALLAALAMALFDDSRIKVLAWIGSGVLTLYTGSMSTMGAMYYALREQQKAQAAGEPAGSGLESPHNPNLQEPR